MTILPRLAMIARAVAFFLLYGSLGFLVVLPLLKKAGQRWAWAHQLADQTVHPVITPLVVVADETASLIIVILASVVMVATERRPRQPPGVFARLPARMNLQDGTRSVRRLLGGFASGMGVFAALMAVLHASGTYRVSPTTTAWPVTLTNASVFLFGFLLVALVEETGLRGYAQSALTDGIGFWPASVLTSFLFGVGHLHGVDSFVGSAGVVLFALFACAILRATGSLWFAIGYHAAWDFSESAIFGALDSGVSASGSLARSVSTGPAWITGGTAGPEASVPCFILDALLLLASIVFIRKQERQVAASTDRTLALSAGP